MAGIALILVLGVFAQWIAWRLRLPSILVLLLFGFLAGPVFHVLNPSEVLGGLLLPIVSLSVALILFEGGMSLRLSELRQFGHVVRNLVSIGAIVTGVVTAIAAHFVVEMPWRVSALLGAILLVTGPTVIGPLLRHVRPAAPLASILRWEGIVIDPIGAMAAVLVFEAVQLGGIHHATPIVVAAGLKIVAVGVTLGFLFAVALVVLIRRHWVPDHLHSPLTLMACAAAFVCSNAIQPESGLFTATVMGIVVGNQKAVVVQHIAEFKETLSVLLISSLFIVLSARLELRQFAQVGWRGLAFLAALIVVARPACVAISTFRTTLSWRQRLFLAAMAPRGIVAAAVSSVFALRLGPAVPGAQLLVPLTFLVIVGTVLTYGLAAGPLGMWLGVAWPNAQGCLIVGAHSLGRAIGLALQEEGCPVMMLDTNRSNIQQARLDGLPAFHGSVVGQDVLERIELGNIGRLLAITSNDEVNSLAAISFARTFGRSEVYQLAHPPGERLRSGRKGEMSRELSGRTLFGQGQTYDALAERLQRGATIRKTLITEEFGLPDFQQLHRDRAVPLFLLASTGEMSVITVEDGIAARPGQKLISMVEPAAVSATEPSLETLERIDAASSR